MEVLYEQRSFTNGDPNDSNDSNDSYFSNDSNDSDDSNKNHMGENASRLRGVSGLDLVFRVKF